jgi:hypothetical protein
MAANAYRNAMRTETAWTRHISSHLLPFARQALMTLLRKSARIADQIANAKRLWIWKTLSALEKSAATVIKQSIALIKVSVAIMMLSTRQQKSISAKTAFRTKIAVSTEEKRIIATFWLRYASQPARMPTWTINSALKTLLNRIACARPITCHMEA